jgi:hypothetical protein
MHYASVTKINRLIQLKGAISVYCGNHNKHKSALCVENAKFSMLMAVVHTETTELYRVKELW